MKKIFARLLGRRGERLAEKFLRRKGYRIVARNFHTRGGEIDLVCSDGTGLVFVEVKTRTAGGLGVPEDAVNRAKQQRLRRAAEVYLTQLTNLQSSYRLDVVSIQTMPDGREVIVHYENITG